MDDTRTGEKFMSRLESILAGAFYGFVGMVGAAAVFVLLALDMGWTRLPPEAGIRPEKRLTSGHPKAH